MTASLATAQQALDALDTDARLTVYVNGVLTDVTGYSGQHGVRQEVATGRLDLLLPRPAWVTPNAPVEVQGGHNDLVGTIWSGFIPNRKSSLTDRGAVFSVSMVGWAALLAEPERYDLVYPGPISARALFVALCELKGVPSYIADQTTYPDGVTEVMLGGNTRINGGAVTIRGGSSPLSQYNRLVEPYGYATFDTPQGPVVLRRVSGMPPGEPVVTFAEGLTIGTVEGDHDTRGIANYFDVYGAEYEDEFGGRVPIRSAPDEWPANPDIYPGGRRYRKVTNSDLVRQDQADAMRENLELNDSVAATPVRWTAVGLPGLAPGDVVAVESATVEVGGRFWLMDLDLSSDDDGFTGSCTGWAGGGVALDALNDRIEIPIQTAPVHLGDETRSNYAVPSPTGRSRQWTFTLPARVSVANCRGRAHGWNSQQVAGEQTDLQVSKWEIWRVGVDQANKDNRPESSGNMPVMNENIRSRLPYNPNANVTFEDGSTRNPIGYYYWSQFAINLRALDAGDWILKLVCGEKAGFDDGEVALVILECYGTTEPAQSIGGRS